MISELITFIKDIVGLILQYYGCIILNPIQYGRQVCPSLNKWDYNYLGRLAKKKISTILILEGK